MPSSYTGAEPICISGVTGGSQQLTVLEAKVSLTGNEWQKHPIVTGPEAPCILGIDYLRRGKDKKRGEEKAQGASHQCIQIQVNGGCKDDRARLFSVVPSGRTRGNGHKVKHRRFHLNIRKHFFTVEVTEHWAQVAQRGCGVSLLGDIQNCLDVVLGNWL
ncbi:hypothetical protein QYF61_013291 [Mycteria americana]|uniref:Uncharacterized protein n=1 Tax=Mycteria americana TaxID=33587 RepID=A0AAN7MJQ7_MYCAM|nr:hypothetical protein QYF61_013291 [Mycteria americana]